MNDKLRSRFTVIGLVLFFSVIFVWPPFSDPHLVTRTVERMIGAEGRISGAVLDWETGKPMVRQVDTLASDDDHVVEVHDRAWYSWFIRRRFDATPTTHYEGEDQAPIEQEFALEDGGSKKLKVRLVKYRQELRVRHTLNLGLDLSGGTELVYRVQPTKDSLEAGQAVGSSSRDQIVQQTESIVNIIKKRINENVSLWKTYFEKRVAKVMK